MQKKEEKIDKKILKEIREMRAEFKQGFESLHCLIKNEKGEIMATLDQLVQSVTDESTVQDSVLALIVSIKATVKESFPNTADQAKIDTAFSKVEANKTKWAQAIVDNTPAAEVPVTTEPAA